MPDMRGRVSEAIQIRAQTNSRVFAGRTLGFGHRDVAYPTAMLSVVNAHQSRATHGGYTHARWVKVSERRDRIGVELRRLADGQTWVGM